MQGGAACEAAGEAGWLGGLPVAIKDLTDVAGCARRMARRSSKTMCRRDRIRWWSGSNGRAASSWASRTRRSSVPAARRSTRYSAGRAIPWNLSLTCGGSTGGGAVSLATGEVWLAQGTDHGGSLRGPGTYCSVVGIRPIAGPGYARDSEQSLVAAVGARTDGAEHSRSRAVSRYDGGILPTRSDDLRCAGGSFVAALARPTAEADRLTVRLQRQDPGRARNARDLPRRRGASRNSGASSRNTRQTSARWTTPSYSAVQHFVVDRESQLRNIAT